MKKKRIKKIKMDENIQKNKVDWVSFLSVKKGLAKISKHS